MTTSRPARSRDSHSTVPGGIRGRQVRPAYATLREAIISGSLAPGSRLVETDLAHRLGLSRSSVRTVLQRLQHEGFLDAKETGTRPRLIVRALTRRDFFELSEVVAQLEGLAAHRVARLAPAARTEAVVKLRAANQELMRAVVAPHPSRARVFKLDDAFHQLLVSYAGSLRLSVLHHAVKPQMQRYEGVYFTMATRARVSIREHGEVIKAIQSGDAAGAHDAIVRNLMNAAQELGAHIESLGERGNF